MVTGLFPHLSTFSLRHRVCSSLRVASWLSGQVPTDPVSMEIRPVLIRSRLPRDSGRRDQLMASCAGRSDEQRGSGDPPDMFSSSQDRNPGELLTGITIWIHPPPPPRLRMKSWRPRKEEGRKYRLIGHYWDGGGGEIRPHWPSQMEILWLRLRHRKSMFFGDNGTYQTKLRNVPTCNAT